MPTPTAAELAARLDRLPSSRHVWWLVTLISLGACFELYDLFLTAYVVPGMVRAGLFTPQSLGIFGILAPLKVAGAGTSHSGAAGSGTGKGSGGTGSGSSSRPARNACTVWRRSTSGSATSIAPTPTGRYTSPIVRGPNCATRWS